MLQVIYYINCNRNPTFYLIISKTTSANCNFQVANNKHNIILLIQRIDDGNLLKTISTTIKRLHIKLQNCISILLIKSHLHIIKSINPSWRRLTPKRFEAGAAPRIGPGRPVPTLEFVVPTLQKIYNVQIPCALCSLPLELPKNIRAFPKECVLRTIN